MIASPIACWATTCSGSEHKAAATALNISLFAITIRILFSVNNFVLSVAFGQCLRHVASRLGLHFAQKLYHLHGQSLPARHLAHSCLGQAVGVAPGPDGIYSIFAVLSGIFANPAGLANAGLYIGNLVLLISISVLTWAQQKLSGAGNNPQLAMMNTIMPVFMAFICLSMPGGVMLYWGLSSLIGIAQQYFVMKKTKEQLAIKPTLHKNKPVSKQNDDDDDEDDEE